MIYIIVSSLIYTGSFIYPQYLWPLIFGWLALCIVTDQENNYSWQAGLLWGAISFTLHFIWLPMALYAKGYTWIALPVYFIVVLYFTSIAAFWFFIKSQLYQLIIFFIPPKDKQMSLCCSWLISTAAFFYLISHCSLAICGCFEGYPFFAPVLPLVYWPSFLQALPLIGCNGYVFVVILINIILAYCLITRKTVIIVILLCVLPFCFSQPPQKPISAIFENIIYLQPHWLNKDFSASHLFYTIAHELDGIALQHPHARYVVMPESSFCFNLLDWQDQLEAWSSLFDPEAIIFIGAHRHENNQIYNCLYAIQDGKIIGWYDKQHVMPFIEQNYFEYGQLEQDNWLVHNFCPWICSELFCLVRKIDSRTPILFVCNDSWLYYDFAIQWAQFYVKLISLRYQVPIVYVGSYECLYFT